LLETVRAIRVKVGDDIPISVKLNSSDFQNGGFSHEECLQVVAWLEEASVDLLEISGGYYEQPSMMGAKSATGEAVRESTVKREAYFMDYAASIRQATKIPLMVSGGFRSRAVMDAALTEGNTDIIGIGRPFCVEADIANKLLANAEAVATAHENTISPAKAGLGWFCLQIIRLADGLNAAAQMTGEEAIALYLKNEEATAAALVERKI